MTRIISAFPCTGKTHFVQNSPVACLDSDSSAYSWSSPGVRNPDFPGNYMTHILSEFHSGKYTYIFVSSHKSVRGALVQFKLPFTLVIPSIIMKPDYIRRAFDRGSSGEFIKVMDDNWADWIHGCYEQVGCEKFVLWSSAQYLDYAIEKMEAQWSIYPQVG